MMRGPAYRIEQKYNIHYIAEYLVSAPDSYCLTVYLFPTPKEIVYIDGNLCLFKRSIYILYKFK